MPSLTKTVVLTVPLVAAAIVCLGFVQLRVLTGSVGWSPLAAAVVSNCTRAGRACAGQKFVLVHVPRPMRATDLVGLRRLCELAGAAHPSFALRVYLPRELTPAERVVLAVRCRVCVEEWVAAEGELWAARMQAVLDPAVAVGLMRSLRSRPTQREATAVRLALDSGATFHVIRDHPTLHALAIPAQLWGFQRGAQRGNCFGRVWKECDWRLGEEAVLACAWSLCMQTNVFAVDAAILPPRAGVEYVGRLADARERDVFEGWKAFLPGLLQRRVDDPVLGCVQKVSGANATRIDGERRFISFSLYGNRGVDRVALAECLRILSQKEVYWLWNVAVFVSDDVDRGFLAELSKSTVPLHIYLVTTAGARCAYLGHDRMSWRGLLPLYLPEMDRFVVRDADSVIRPREWFAVQEWIASGLNLHLMRDSISGHNQRVMGGMWGSLSKVYGDAAALFRHHTARSYGNDQWFWGGVLFHRHRDAHLAHDSHTCVERLALPFPSPADLQHFVGQSARYSVEAAPDAPACDPVLYDSFLA